jgi:hypothetical protein
MPEIMYGGHQVLPSPVKLKCTKLKIFGKKIEQKVLK